MSDKKYTSSQAAQLRAAFISKQVVPMVRRAFAKHPVLRSATLLVGQYWNDEALDAVHCEVLFSELATPDTEAAYQARAREYDGNDYAQDPPRNEQAAAPAWRKWFPWLTSSNAPLPPRESQSVQANTPEAVNLPSGLKQSELDSDHVFTLEWDSNGESISLFAAFCQEDCHQEMEPGEAYSPYAIFRRRSSDIDVEVVGVMVRPWLDGICPQDDADGE